MAKDSLASLNKKQQPYITFMYEIDDAGVAFQMVLQIMKLHYLLTNCRDTVGSVSLACKQFAYRQTSAKTTNIEFPTAIDFQNKAG